jgi:signal transduction histidine kinase
MTRRLVLSYVGLAFLILILLEVPFGLLAQRHERDMAASQAEREATGLAAVASEDVEHHRTADLNAVIGRYQARAGGELVIVDPASHVLASSRVDADNDATGEQRNLVQAALSGRSVSSFTSDEGQPWATAAVPISSDNQPAGAVLLGVLATSTENRIDNIWLALGGFAAAILALTTLVGLLLARSLARPLARLESTVTRLGDGDLSVRAGDEGPPQVRSLARQFNQMAGRLAELVEAQNRFVADASHQLRSPLTALRLRLENLEAGAEAGSAEGIAAAAEEVQRLSRIVDGLLTLSRVGSDEPDRRTVDVETVIEGRCDAWSALAAERQVDLSPDMGTNPPATAVLVPGDLEQILDNLLANALDASPEGGRISVQLTPSDHNQFEVHVTDEGPGMSPDDRQRAFDRFWQGTGSNGGHSGLGLAIVRQLAARNQAAAELREARPSGVDAVITLTAASDRGRQGELRSETVKKSRDSRSGPR